VGEVVIAHTPKQGGESLAVLAGSVCLIPRPDDDSLPAFVVVPRWWGLEYLSAYRFCRPLPGAGDWELADCVCGRAHWLPLRGGA